MAIPQEQADLIPYVHLKLAALGVSTTCIGPEGSLARIAGPLLRSHIHKDRGVGEQFSPADGRIQQFLDAYLAEACGTEAARLPSRTFVLDRPGLSRVLSFPPDAPDYASPYLNSYRVPQGVLHNPKSDRRTTKGVFHIAEGGFPIPADKETVPARTFAALLAAALQPPPDALTLPFTAHDPQPARMFVSLLLRPLVCPATGRDPNKRMEIRFFAPGSLVSNLDFVESIFGNGGDPYLPENDAALDAAHWTGHTGCVILAPHLISIKKKAVGLPHISEATERQKRDGMCWSDPGEAYNDGKAFQIRARDHRGVNVTIIADNYYGYCKKEVKTQISFSANLFGLCEEEHAGGAIASPSYILGQEFYADRTVSLKKTRFDDAMRTLDGLVDLQPEGYAVDRAYPDIFYVPESSTFNVLSGDVRWPGGSLTLRADAAYVLPSGFRVRLEKQMSGTTWRLVGTRPRGTLCHKPCTVSGGGKSEISKSLANAVLKGPVFVRDYHRDMEHVAEILKMDFSNIFKNRAPDTRSARPVLSFERSLGSVIQLLTPSSAYGDRYNEWLHELPPTTRQLVFTVKRYYRPEWGEDWAQHFTVDRINGLLGHELKFDNQKLVANYLRVGYDADGSWRIFKLRPDFYPAEKVQVEDDITASVVLPRESLSGLDPEYSNPSVKLVQNCETLLFQRPDDAVHRGADREAEKDFAGFGMFFSNYEPLSVDQALAMVEHVAEFDKFTDPIKGVLTQFAHSGNGMKWVVSSSHPRIVDGAFSKNPRYLQKRPDLEAPRQTHLTAMAARLERGIPAGCPVPFPVNAVLGGRRGNPADPKSGQPPLAVYGPLHYQELPELFMEFISSLTGKSPSMIGFGSEGALTKGPFNGLWPVVDLNNALVSAIVTGYAGFTTSAGYVGPSMRVDHDVSLLTPEVWCRMRVSERDPQFLISNGYLERVPDFSWDGRAINAGRLGYRITALFVDRFLGRIFESPSSVFPDEMLRPERQNLGLFVEGVEAIVDSQRRVALNYFEDGSVEAACPPLKALLHLMAYGQYEGSGIESPGIRGLFDRQAMLQSGWYRERLQVKQQRDIALWKRHAAALEAYRVRVQGTDPELDLFERGSLIERELQRVSRRDYVGELIGTIGADPFHGQV